MNFAVLILFQELSSFRREKERLTEELFEKTDEKQTIEVLLNQAHLENQRLTKKVENFEILGMCLKDQAGCGDRSPTLKDYVL